MLLCMGPCLSPKLPSNPSTKCARTGWIRAKCLRNTGLMGLSAIRNVDYVILLCDDVQQMKGFYQDVMGFRIEEDNPHWVRFRIGKCALTLRPRGPWLVWKDGSIPRGSSAVHLAFCVGYDEVDACHAELSEKSVDVIEGPKDQQFGHRTVFFRDPECNVLEIYAEIDSA